VPNRILDPQHGDPAAERTAAGRFQEPSLFTLLFMDRDSILDTLRKNEAALRTRGVSHAALFGSRARDEGLPDSDTDIIIDLDPEAKIGVYEYVALKEFIASLFDGPVDVVTREGLKPLFATPQLVRRWMRFKSSFRALRDILYHIDLVQSWTTAQTLEDFVADQRTVYAVTRCLEIISAPASRGAHFETLSPSNAAASAPIGKCGTWSFCNGHPKVRVRG
jgi:predicted nucleotidyltransferase